MSNQKNKICGVLGLGLALASVVPGAIVNNASAEGDSSVWDTWVTKSCIITSWNAEHPDEAVPESIEGYEDVSEIEGINPAQLKKLTCDGSTNPNGSMINFRGITQFTNLEELIIPNNPSLKISEMDFSQNTKLKKIDVTGSYNTGSSENIIGYFNFSNNPALESIITDKSMHIVSTAYAEAYDSEKYDYKLDYSKLKFIDSVTINEEDETYPAKHDEEKGVVYYEEKVPSAIAAKKGDINYTLSTRGYNVRNIIYLEGPEESELFDSAKMGEVCEQKIQDETTYYICTEQAFSGDTFNTDEYIEYTLAPIFNLEWYNLSKIEIVPPTANLAFDTNTDTSKIGTYKPSNEMGSQAITFKYHFELRSDIEVPDTGYNTKEQSGAEAIMKNVAIVMASLAAIAAGAIFAIRSLGHKVKFTRK